MVPFLGDTNARGGHRTAKSGGPARVRVVGGACRTRSALMLTTALQAATIMVLAMPAQGQPAPNAQPSGGVVIGGVAAINQTSSNTLVTQSSQRAAVNWKSFDVGSKQSVTFQQPNANSVVLNTVTGPNPSHIAGRIDANGQVVLVNQSGVTFYKGSQVNTAGLMVSASGTDPVAFMNGGKIAFDRPGNPNAKIINGGNITIRDAGLAALVAPSVANSGEINAKLGHVVLAGARTATLDLYGDKLMSVNVTGAVERAPDGGEALVTNSGLIQADGGTVRLTAKAVDGLVTNLVSAGGNIQARTVGAKKGRIKIDGVGGSIVIDGNLDARGQEAGTVGGDIGLLASGSVVVKSAAVINASGAAGGGNIAIGTTMKRARGGPAVVGQRTAQGVLVQPGATISADATASGDGGRVTVLSSKITAAWGTISAKGGPAGGNGGFVEVSGDAGYSLGGSVDVSAAIGQPGTILLDPTDLTIIAGAANDGSADPLITGGTLDASAGPATATVSNGILNSLVGAVELNATQDVFVNAPVNRNSASDFTIRSGHDITVNAGITVSGGGGILLEASYGSGSFSESGPLGAITVNAPLTADRIVLGSGAGITLASDITTPNLLLRGVGNDTPALVDLLRGPIVQTAGAINATALSARGTDVSLNLSSNHIGTLGTVIAETGNIDIRSASDMTVSVPIVAPNTSALTLMSGGSLLVPAGAPLFGGTIRLSAAEPTMTGFNPAGALILNGDVQATAPGTLLLSGGTGGIQIGGTISGTRALTIDISSTGPVTQTGAGMVANRLTSSFGVGGNVTLTGSNEIDTIADFAVTGGSFTFANDVFTSLTVDGQLAATAVALTAPAIDIRGTITTGSASAGSVSLIANAGSIFSGPFFDLSETETPLPPFYGSVVTGTLNATATSSINLNGANAIGTFGPVISSFGTVSLHDDAPLVVSGPVAASSITLVAPAFAIPGSINSSGSLGPGGVRLTATGGSIVGTGPITTGALSADATGAIALDGTGNAIRSADLTGTSVSLATGTPLTVNGTATGGDFAVSSGAAGGITIDREISATGTVSVAAQTLSLGTIGSIAGSTFEFGPGLNGTTALNGGAVTLGTGGGLVSLARIDAPTIRIGRVRGTTTASSIEIGSAFDLGGRALELHATGAVTQSAPLLDVGVLSGSAGSYALTDGGNIIGRIGDLTATGSLAVVDSTALTVSAPVSAADVSLTANGSLTLDANVTGAQVGLVANGGDVSESGAAAVTAGVLRVAGRSVSLMGTNRIDTLADSSAGGGDFGLRNTGALTVAGPVSASRTLTLVDADTITLGGQLTAPRINVDNGTGTTRLADGLTIRTGGESRPTGDLTADQLPSRTGTSGGFYLATGRVTQTGVLSVPGDPAIVRIDATRGIQFASSGGLFGPHTWLVLGLSDGAVASGRINVGALDVLYRGPRGGATLIGAVNGSVGREAASTSHIQPAVDSAYLMNGCLIGSTICNFILTAVPNVAVSASLAAIEGASAAARGNYQLNTFMFGSVLYPSDTDDLLLPLASDLDY